MTTSTAGSPSQSRILGQLGRALDWRFDHLQSEYLAGSPSARADLATLRRALGKTAGSVPEVWEYTIAAVPESLQWDRDEPSYAEQAAHAALTLFALHLQSMSGPAHVRGVSFGRAVGRLARMEGRSADAVTRRFMAVATAQSIDEILVHVRGLVTQLRSVGQGFDYARFADDALWLLNPRRSKDVRIAWGRDFYRSDSKANAAATESQPDNKRSETL
ncbi:type I-E CRISPR-associated protein Cse2/CasB [Mycobacterium celatum]|uniref:Type I-E CRISPR-associated protein Cse2/CasB n=1 Tax=Mycobacterium celatum TaxID=28045 RepID=A0A1X1RUW2_MYCCE|nr:type I-E CRISPR-associated protein Cse2/CasB [Mycobacterium celatum]ORV18167.1 type I-E CRISPR-associated protein Cse2/CasB [Mycobacterium celatum]PIB80640.1 type I-E CRISPR-associated protein Cse2/CasB [Mycobacterium celatum]